MAPAAAVRLALAMILAAALSTTMSVEARAETIPHYDLQVWMAYAQDTLVVTQTTTFRNNTGVELPQLVFQVVPAYFDAFSLDSARVDGGEVQSSLDGTVLELQLDRPLAPGATTEVQLAYRIVVPPINGRFGRGEGILALGNWFPVLAVYSNGWDRHQYVDVGDAFYTESADFDVTVTSDVPVEIAASGQLLWQGGTTRVFHAEGVRDFGMAASDRYLVRSRTVDGVQLLAYGLSATRLELYLDEAEELIRWYSANLVPYPYPSFSIAEVTDRRYVPIAQEYPGLIFIYSALGADGGGPGSYSQYLIGHELAHQWFYSLVGDDQVHDPWLDEAMVTYVNFLFYRDKYPSIFNSLWQQRNVAAYRSRVAIGGDRPVNTTIYDYPDDLPYFDVVYRKGAIFLDQLRELMGDEPFMELLQQYVQTYSGKVATPRAFLDMAYQKVGDDLPPLVDRYFSYGAFSGGEGYRLQVEWPSLSPSEPAELAFSSDFHPTEVKVWLDNRLLYDGSGESPAVLNLDGVEEGEYVMRVDLIDGEGALYQRAERVKVTQ